jgi:hypothetical protein
MAKKKIEPQRILKVNLFEGDPIELEISKAIELRTNQPAIYIEKLKDGKFRLAYDVSLIPDFCNVKNIEVVRIDAD